MTEHKKRKYDVEKLKEWLTPAEYIHELNLARIAAALEKIAERGLNEK